MYILLQNVNSVYFLIFFHPFKSEGRRLNGRFSSSVETGRYLKTGIWFNQGSASFESTRITNSNWSRVTRVAKAPSLSVAEITRLKFNQVTFNFNR